VNTLIILLANENALGRIVVAIVASTLIFGIFSLVRGIKYRKSDEGKLHRKINKKKSALSHISKYESQKEFINKDLIDEKKKELYGEIENDIFHYKLNTNKEYIQLKKLNKQGILDDASFNQAVKKIKKSLIKKTDDKIKTLELDNGEKITFKQILKNTIKNSTLLSHLDLYNDQMLFSGENVYYISENKIKNIYTIRKYENGLVFAQQKNVISFGDILLESKKVLNNELINILSFCSVRMKGNKVVQVYWIKKGQTLNKKNIEIYQKNKNNRTFSDLVFINSEKSKDGFHFANMYGSLAIIRTKNGKVR
tara:strand:+ start:90 stop:1019 length:930 start_codon:yes stop_codon:yes gene_type:complete